MSNLNWLNLPLNCCPKCSAKLLADQSLLDTTIYCSAKCGFTISEVRMQEIIQSQKKEADKRASKYANRTSTFFPNILPSRSDFNSPNYKME